MGRFAQFFHYVSAEKQPTGADLWTFSHLTITDEIKNARRAYLTRILTHYQVKNMKLNRPICFFDTESTGTNPAKDRIVSLAVIKLHPDGSKEERDMLLNPECPIPEEASAVHGIRDEMVVGKPKFRQIAPSLYAFLQGCDIGGYNIVGFDIPLMAEEFERYNDYVLNLAPEYREGRQYLEFPLPGTKIVDACVIFKKKEERTLSAAVEFYLHRKMEHAHDAQADTKASLDVFEAQLDHYADLKELSVEEISEFCKYEGPQRIDLKGVFLIDSDGDAIFGGGKHKDAKCSTQKGYIQWMLGPKGAEFYTRNTLKVAQRILDGIK